MFSADSILVSDWSLCLALMPGPRLRRASSAFGYRYPSVIPCVRCQTGSGLLAWYPLPLLCCLFGVSRVQSYTSMIFSTNNLELNKPLTSH